MQHDTDNHVAARDAHAVSDREILAEAAFAAYVGLAQHAWTTRQFADARAAGEAWGRFLALFAPASGGELTQ